MGILISLAFGILLGIVQVGSATWRTLQVLRGHYLHTWIPSAAVSVAYFFGTLFVVQGNIPGYIGFSIGAATITSWMAWKNAKVLGNSNSGKPCGGCTEYERDNCTHVPLPETGS